MELDQAIDSIWEAGELGLHYPAELKGRFSLEEGYRVQLGLLHRHLALGSRLAGWKICLNHAPIKNQFNLFDPVFGFLLEENRLCSGDSLSFDDLIEPCLESELCVTLGAPLKGPGVTPRQARAAIRSISPALELVERRGGFSADLALTLMDNVQQKGFVLGPEVAQLPEKLVVPAAELRVEVNGEPMDIGREEDPVGPSEAVAWLANRLADFGLALEAGQQVMTGSITRQFAPSQGDFVEAFFGPFGRVQLYIS